MDDRKDRKELLLKMYDQLFNDINRHILVVWQAVGVVVGSFAIFALAEKQIVPIDVAVALVVLLCGWMLAQLYDSAYWYNRNLVIIANIEKEFLSIDDLSKIHFYFGSHRKNNKMIGHLRIQRYLGIGITVVVLVYHFHAAKIWHGFSLPFSALDFYKTLPYLALLVAGLFVNYVRNRCDDGYAEILATSPGKDLGLPPANKPGHGMLRSVAEDFRLALRLRRPLATTIRPATSPEDTPTRKTA